MSVSWKISAQKVSDFGQAVLRLWRPMTLQLHLTQLWNSLCSLSQLKQGIPLLLSDNMTVWSISLVARLWNGINAFHIHYRWGRKDGLRCWEQTRLYWPAKTNALQCHKKSRAPCKKQCLQVTETHLNSLPEYLVSFQETGKQVWCYQASGTSLYWGTSKGKTNLIYCCGEAKLQKWFKFGTLVRQSILAGSMLPPYLLNHNYKGNQTTCFVR